MFISKFSLESNCSLLFRCFDLVSYKLYIYIYICRHVFFLKHILLFSITIEFHNVSKIEFIHINHFLDNTDSFIVDSGTLVLNCHTPFSLPMATPTPFEIVHPPPPCSS